MSDISSVLEQSAEWAELSDAILRGRAPHALAVVMQHESAVPFYNLYAKQLLCHSGSGADDCASCRGWAEDGHPDLMVLGSRGTPPGVADCIALRGQLSLRPVVGRCRLAVIFGADNLLPVAANSMLKITEEPPEDGYILFLAERDSLMSTIRSRVWLISFASRDLLPAQPASPPPNTPAEWSSWIERTKKHTLEELSVEVGGWIRIFCESEEWSRAASVENLLFLAEKRRMPALMVQDALYLLLKEDVQSEEIFGNLREA